MVANIRALPAPCS